MRRLDGRGGSSNVVLAAVAALIFGSSCGRGGESPGAGSGPVGTIRASLSAGAGVAAVQVGVSQNGALVASQTTTAGTIDAGVGSPLGDVYFVLLPGTYQILATPLDADGNIMKSCTPAQTSAEVAADATTEVILTLVCGGQKTGGLDVTVKTAASPGITGLEFAPSKYTTTCAPITITATATDPLGETLSFKWSISATPAQTDSSPTTILVPNGASATFITDTVGDYTLLLVVTNTDGLTATLSFPVHVLAGDTTTCQAAWRASMSNAIPAAGCFTSKYPSAAWLTVPCTTAPATHQNVGNGTDFSAKSSGSIVSATGSFPMVTGLVTSESASTGGVSPFSLQMNPNALGFTFMCTGGGPNCVGAQQFIYSDSGEAYIEYWLLDWGSSNPCPQGFASVSHPADPTTVDCVQNTAAVGVAAVASITSLGSLEMVGKAMNGMDEVIMTTTGGDLQAFSVPSVLGLQGQWNEVEFNFFGDGNGSTANINAGLTTPVTVVVKTTVEDGTTNAPQCDSTTNMGVFTEEMNSLTLGSCFGVGGALPFIQFIEETNSTPTQTPPPASCPAPVRILADTGVTSGPDCGGTSRNVVLGNTTTGTCDSGYGPGTCSATLISANNGSTCAAMALPGCQCLVHVTTPSGLDGCSKSAICHVLVTEQPMGTNVPQVVMNAVPSNGADCGGTTHTQTFSMSCDANFFPGNCVANLVTVANGSTCALAASPGDCGCAAQIMTPSGPVGCNQSASCSLVSAEVPTGWPAACPAIVNSF